MVFFKSRITGLSDWGRRGKLFLLGRPDWRTSRSRGSRASLRGRRDQPHDGVRESPDVFNHVERPCWPFDRQVSWLLTRSPALRPQRERSASPSGRISCASAPRRFPHTVARRTTGGCMPKRKLGFVAPHPVQHDGDLARDSDARPRHADGCSRSPCCGFRRSRPRIPIGSRATDSDLKPAGVPI